MINFQIIFAQSPNNHPRIFFSANEIKIEKYSQRLIGDTNDDGVVNLADIVNVVNNFWRSIFNPKTDVNEDNKVNLYDIVIVARKSEIYAIIGVWSDVVARNYVLAGGGEVDAIIGVPGDLIICDVVVDGGRF